MLVPAPASNTVETEKDTSMNVMMETIKTVTDAAVTAELNQVIDAQEEPLILLINAIIKFPQGSPLSKQDKSENQQAL